MKHLLLLCIAFAFVSTSKAQQALIPDTLISINADDYSRAEYDQLFEFSDGSKAFLIFGLDTMTVAPTVNDTNYSIFCPQYYRVLYVVDSNYQFKNAIAIKQTNLVQVGDTLFGTSTALWGQSYDLNPAGNPVLATGFSNPNLGQSYLVAYDKDLQLVRHQLINTNTFTSAKMKAISNGKIYLTIWEKDPHPQGGQFAIGRQLVETYDMNFNLLASHTYYSKQGTYWNFDMLDHFQVADNGGFYGYFTNGAVGYDFDIGLNGTSTIRPNDQNALGYLVKYDANLNVLWDVRITYDNPNSIVATNRIYDSPNGDSLLWVGSSGFTTMYYQNGTNIDTLEGDSSYTYNEHICTINKTTGQIQRHHPADIDFIYGEGAQMLRFGVSSKSSFSGIVTPEYLNFYDNTFQIPDSTVALAIYDDPTTGIPTTYRMLGYLAPNSDFWPSSMLNSQVSNTLYISGRYANGYKLDNTSSYTLPDFNGTSSTFLSAYKLGTVTGTADLFAPEFELYPNPCVDYLRVAPGSRNAVSLQVVSLEGKALANRLIKGMEEVQLETSHLPSGMYFVQVTYRNGEKIGKRFMKN